MLVFFTFMPLGAAIGGIGGALLFGVIAIRDAEIAIEREPCAPARPVNSTETGCICAMQKWQLCFSQNRLLLASTNRSCSNQARRRMLTPSGPLLFATKFRDQTKMTEHSLWRFSRALHRAINERQPADLEALLDDDVDWAIYGPIDMFPFFGSRQGKAAVIEVIRQIAENVRVHRFDRELIMLGVDSASSMMRYSLTALDSNKPISLRIAHFAQFKAGRLTNFRVLVDTFDLVEQTVGYPIHLPRMAV